MCLRTTFCNCPRVTLTQLLTLLHPTVNGIYCMYKQVYTWSSVTIKGKLTLPFMKGLLTRVTMLKGNIIGKNNYRQKIIHVRRVYSILQIMEFQKHSSLQGWQTSFFDFLHLLLVLHLNLLEEGKTKQPSLTLSVKFILKGHEFVSY